MAELPNIGKHCSVGSCKLLDFLPFACDGCKKIFCSEHRVKDVHCCSSEYISKATGEFSGVKGYDCSLLGCKKRELTPIMCEKCRLSFCLSHRHEVDHNCSKLEKTDTTTSVSRTAEHVKTILESKTGESSKRRQGVKNAKMAAKVSLMKMKMKSLGDPGCPEAERVYFQVYPPLECQKPEQPLYFSKVWTIGRAIDSIAERLKLPNKNNVQDAKNLKHVLHEKLKILEKSLDELQMEHIHWFPSQSWYMTRNCAFFLRTLVLYLPQTVI
ncbi:AN1-type zinc finger protein 1-like isoform X2 [Dreissena polymorpha]|uniref:AN1-type zinc finger protein 1-like isoform X2 n=1 Tax=Dreissena polymorpha TaxID=45954 RepID=UPI0022646FF7|nr:AN1-type zinc finger protein 1-like isoform X2 [Dreissena polymorpha]